MEGKEGGKGSEGNRREGVIKNSYVWDGWETHYALCVPPAEVLLLWRRARVAFVWADRGRQAGGLGLASALYSLREYLSYRVVTNVHQSRGEKENSPTTVNLADITRYMWQVASIGL